MAVNFTDFVAGNVLEAAQLNDVLDNFSAIAIFNETQNTGTNGGTSTGATWTKRVFNTTLVNNIGATISSSVITLLAGTYLVEGSAPFCNSNNLKLRFRNTSDGTNALIGQSNSLVYNTGASSGLSIPIMGVFTIAATKNFELQYYVENGQANTGLGSQTQLSGVSEVYAQIKIQRIA